VYFFGLAIMVELPEFYTDALITDKLKDEIFADNQELRYHNRGADIEWKSRSMGNKFMRILYRFHRAIYVSCFFYFSPMIFLILYRLMAVKPPEGVKVGDCH